MATRSTKNVTKRNQKLDSNALKAFKILGDENYDNRIAYLEEHKEYGYALLNQWNKIEKTLKLLKYYDNINGEFPLVLISKKFNTNWTILRKIDKTLLKHILKIGETKKEKSNALHSIRDEIVHYNKVIDNDTYQEYKKYVAEFLHSLKSPNKEEFQKKKNNARNKKKEQANQ